MKKLIFSWAALVLLILPRGLFALEIHGQVVEAAPGSVKIASDSEYVPSVGDKVEIYFQIAGLDEKAHIGSGTVTAIQGEWVLAKIASAKTKLVAGQFATISSANPKKKKAPVAPAPPESQDPTPPAPPEPEEPRDSYYAVYSLTNSTQESIPYAVKWGCDRWDVGSLAPGESWCHYQEYDKPNENSSPIPSIKFGSGGCTLLYELDPYACADNDDLDASKQYKFVLKNGVLDLVSTN